MSHALLNTFAGRPLPREMADQLMATTLRDAGPESKEYVVLIDLDCERTYFYDLTDCANHHDACTGAINDHRLAGCAETPLMTCRVGGPCKEIGCNCGGSMLMLRIYALKGRVSTTVAAS